MSDDLVSRLRASRAALENARGVPTRLEAEAADRIEAMTAERDMLIKVLKYVVSEYDRFPLEEDDPLMDACENARFVCEQVEGNRHE